jgi:hypothetical protein
MKKKETLLSNNGLVSVPVAADTHITIDVLLEAVCSTLPVQRAYKGDNRGNKVNFVWDVVKKRDSWNVVEREPPFREDLNAEAETSPLLESVTRERLVKALQAGKFSGSCGDL